LLGGSSAFPAGPPDWPSQDVDIEHVFSELLDRGDWGRYHGPHCDQLIERLKQFHRCAHAILCSSGTAAVELALRSVNVGPGDEVVMSAFDFKANFQNILTVGAVPVLVDIHPGDLQLDPTRLEEALSDRTKAVLVSHLSGATVDVAAIRELADPRGIAVIEDACQMHGADLRARIAGTWGDMGVLSFGGSKLMTSGRGGAILTDRDDIAQRIRLYAFRGNDAYPLSEMQAAVLIPQLDRLDERNARRRKSVGQLAEALGSESPLRICTGTDPESSPSFYKVAFWYESASVSGLSRERFCEAMRAEGFALDPWFRSLDLMHSRRRFRTAGDLSTAHAADRNVVVLHHPILLDASDWPERFANALGKIGRFADDLQHD
jgi:perosamine synthetase